MVTLNIERRKSNNPRLTVSQVVDKMQDTADDKYAGDLQDNILSIFLDMDAGSQKTYLRKSLLLHWEKQIELAAINMTDVVIDEDTCIDRTSVASERKNITELNYAEQIHLKTWMVKTFFFTGISLFITFVGVSLTIGELNMDTAIKYMDIITDAIFSKM